MVVNNHLNSDSKYSALESFRAKGTTPVTQPAQILQEQDKVEVSVQPNPAEQPKKKTSFFQKMKNAYASFKKFCISTTEYTKGTFKGFAYGAVAVSSVLGVDAVLGVVKRIKADKVAENAVKVLSTKGKIFAGIAGVATMGYQLFKAHLNSNEKRAAVDHRWGTGHSQDS